MDVRRNYEVRESCIRSMTFLYSAREARRGNWDYAQGFGDLAAEIIGIFEVISGNASAEKPT